MTVAILRFSFHECQPLKANCTGHRHADDRQILGCAILGVEGGEVMAVLRTAMLGRLPYPVIGEGAAS